MAGGAGLCVRGGVEGGAGARFSRRPVLSCHAPDRPALRRGGALIGGLSAQELDANRKALELLPAGAELLNPDTIHEPARLRLFATASTWGVLGLEAGVALLMLIPPTRRIPLLRHALLLTFCGVTYTFAPVAGFGWLLLVMGLAQLEPRQTWLGRAYVVAFVVVLFYDAISWADLALRVLA